VGIDNSITVSGTRFRMKAKAFFPCFRCCVSDLF